MFFPTSLTFWLQSELYFHLRPGPPHPNRLQSSPVRWIHSTARRTAVHTWLRCCTHNGSWWCLGWKKGWELGNTMGNTMGNTISCTTQLQLCCTSQMACQLTANMSAKQIDMTGCISFSVSLGSPEQILAVSSDHVPCDLLAIFAPNPLINHGENCHFLRKCQDF